jgi:hypothetical protein
MRRRSGSLVGLGGQWAKVTIGVSRGCAHLSRQKVPKYNRFFATARPHLATVASSTATSANGRAIDAFRRAVTIALLGAPGCPVPGCRAAP